MLVFVISVLHVPLPFAADLSLGPTSLLVPSCGYQAHILISHWGSDHCGLDRDFHLMVRGRRKTAITNRAGRQGKAASQMYLTVEIPDCVVLNSGVEKEGRPGRGVCASTESSRHSLQLGWN